MAASADRLAFFDEHVAVRLLGDHRRPEFGEDAVAEGVVEVGVRVDQVPDRISVTLDMVEALPIVRRSAYRPPSRRRSR